MNRIKSKIKKVPNCNAILVHINILCQYKWSNVMLYLLFKTISKNIVYITFHILLELTKK